MKICIYGAGAIGGFLGAELSLAGSDVTLIARGPHLEAMQSNGLTLLRDGETRVAHPAAYLKPSDAGPQDYVILTLKAHSVTAIVDDIQPLLGPDTTIVWGVNGIPWWYFYKLEGAYLDKRLPLLDPGDAQWDKIDPDRILGCIVYPAAEVVAPGVVQHIEGDRFSFGEPDGQKSDRAQALAQEFIKAGLRSPIRPRIRDELWVKLWGNVSFNPISALTGTTLAGMCTDPALRKLIRAMMVEAQEVAEALGVKFAIDVDKRIDGGMAVGDHKTSMLQDLERGRPMEIDALVGAVADMGDMTGVDTPNIDSVLSLVRARARTAGCYD
ncbi:MAG: 2-dehydropantoate 2-reductase [Proteobacteria bacterium]|nr:2-dehydropantoate 2-reductase [Pseudomonadota bacterium]